MATIPVKTAALIARFHLVSKAHNSVVDSVTLSYIGANVLEESPLLIHDLLGAPLYYDFFVYKENTLVGRLRVSAESALGVSLNSFEQLDSFPNLDEKKKQARSVLLMSEHPDEIIDDLLICYSDHKLGFRLRYNKSGNRMTAIFDILEDCIVSTYTGDTPDIGEKGTDIGEDNEGVAVYSIMNEIPEGGDPASKAEEDINLIGRIMHEVLSRCGRIRSLNKINEIGLDELQQIQQYFENNPPIVSEIMLPIAVVGQKTPVYCAIASAEMILKYYGFNYSQDQIATAMKPDSSGCTNNNQMTAYKQLSNDSLVTIYDTSPSFEEAFESCNLYMPMKSGVPGHARVCRGWKKYIYISPLSGQVLKEERWYLINDPWPVNQGSIRWENSDSLTYRNFIFVKRKGTDIGGSS